MFIRSSTAINDCLIALDRISLIVKTEPVSSIDNQLEPSIWVGDKRNEGMIYRYVYKSTEARDKAFDELCAFLNTNYKLRDFT